MQNLMVVPAGVVAVCMGTILVYGGLPPRGQPLPNAEIMEQYIFKGLFPDKPDNMSFVQYCRQYTELDSNLSQVLERLEFNVLDAENLENVIKLSEDLMRLREERRPPAPRGSQGGPADARRSPAPRDSPAGPADARRPLASRDSPAGPADVRRSPAPRDSPAGPADSRRPPAPRDSPAGPADARWPPAPRDSPAGPADARQPPALRGFPAGPADARRLWPDNLAGMAATIYTDVGWDIRQRNKLVDFMQYAVYSAKYEINKMNELRRRWVKDMVFRIGLIHGRQLELKASAALLFSTLTKVSFDISMIWFVFQYHKLLNMAYDVTSNTEQMFLLNEGLKESFKLDNFDQVQTPPPHSG